MVETQAVHFGQALRSPEHEAVRRRAMFECCKWDPRVEDVDVLSPAPLLLSRAVWRELSGLAEALAREALAAERELIARPDLHRRLGLGWSLRRALRGAAAHPAHGVARVMRFDFHRTTEGWRISEVNSDVPGGFVEASGYTRLMAEAAACGVPAGDPAASLAAAVAAATRAGAIIGLVHATCYTDDRQVMLFLAKQLEQAGLRPVLIGPDQLRWSGGYAEIYTDWYRGRAEGLVRFFPAEWLINVPRRCGWKRFFGRSATSICNPATALLTQSKRFPLVWDRLTTKLDHWRRLLPETHDPAEVAWQNRREWVLKPALGRVGEAIGMAGVTTEKQWQMISRDVRRYPRHWIAQRRFDSVPLVNGHELLHVCLGVYTIDGTAAGVYARASSSPLIDHQARDVAVLVEESSPAITATGRRRDVLPAAV